MAEYVDQVYYTKTYYGEDVDDALFSRYLARATDIINSLTCYQLVKQGGLDKLELWQQELVKKAVCAQIEYYQIEGLTADQGQSESGSSFSLSKFSVSAKSNTISRQAQRASPAAIAALRAAGLLNESGVSIRVI
ncbi:hypothetical protein AB0Y04_04800 [Loigolactobacillus coryniformis]|uniref:hypothetical protein n=1 Tax=Loigolactobacillus coryniformis TaxID=1610 RepID=UPI003F219998